MFPPNFDSRSLGSSSATQPSPHPPLRGRRHLQIFLCPSGATTASARERPGIPLPKPCRSQVFSTSQRFQQLAASRLCFAPLTPMGHRVPEDNSSLRIRAPLRADTPLPLETPRRKAHRTPLSRAPFHDATSPKTSDPASPAPASPRLTTPDDQPEGQPARSREGTPEHATHDPPSVGVRHSSTSKSFSPQETDTPGRNQKAVPPTTFSPL